MTVLWSVDFRDGNCASKCFCVGLCWAPDVQFTYGGGSGWQSRSAPRHTGVDSYSPVVCGGEGRRRPRSTQIRAIVANTFPCGMTYNFMNTTYKKPFTSASRTNTSFIWRKESSSYGRDGVPKN